MLALCGSTNKELSPSLVTWLQQCPDVKEMKSILKEYMWLETDCECSECGETYKQRDMRWDVGFPFSDGQSLICHDCWNFFCEPTIANPDGIDEPWPSSVSSKGPTQNVNLMDGFIIDETDHVIGTVTGYNKKFHTGKVCLYGYETDAELGSLQPEHKVVTHCEGYEKAEINMDKYKPYVCDGEEWSAQISKSKKMKL